MLNKIITEKYENLSLLSEGEKEEINITCKHYRVWVVWGGVMQIV